MFFNSHVFLLASSSALIFYWLIPGAREGPHLVI